MGTSPSLRVARVEPAAPEPPLQVTVLVSSGQAVVALDGDVDVTAAPLLAAAARDLAATGAPVVVDASGVRFMDCAGLRAVTDLAVDCSGVTVRNPSPAVRWLLELAGGAAVRVDVGRSA